MFSCKDSKLIFWLISFVISGLQIVHGFWIKGKKEQKSWKELIEELTWMVKVLLQKV